MNELIKEWSDILQ